MKFNRENSRFEESGQGQMWMYAKKQSSYLNHGNVSQMDCNLRCFGQNQVAAGQNWLEASSHNLDSDVKSHTCRNMQQQFQNNYANYSFYPQKKLDYGVNCAESLASERASLRKPRGLSNEFLKKQNYASDCGFGVEQSYDAAEMTNGNNFDQNQITDQELSFEKGNINDCAVFERMSSASSSKASTNDNSHSDVEIIEDSFAQTLQPIGGFGAQYNSKSCNFGLHDQTTSVDQISGKFNFQKTQSYYQVKQSSLCSSHDMSEDVFGYCGSSSCEATRQTQKKKFVNREDRVKFNQKIEKMKKTEMCRNIVMYGNCKYGDTCSYAHNMDELVPKQHLPSNYKTKLCTQYQEQGYCMYGERCQFLHSIYDLSDKTNFSYKRGLAEEARLTWQRIQQGSDCILVNLLKGKGCVAPEQRLPCFEQIYNKIDYQAEQLKKDQQKQSYSYSSQLLKYQSQSSKPVYYSSGSSYSAGSGQMNQDFNNISYQGGGMASQAYPSSYPLQMQHSQKSPSHGFLGNQTLYRQNKI